MHSCDGCVQLAAGLGAPSAADESARSAAAAASSAAVEAVGSLADVQPLLKDLYGQMADKADRCVRGVSC